MVRDPKIYNTSPNSIMIITVLKGCFNHCLCSRKWEMSVFILRFTCCNVLLFHVFMHFSMLSVLAFSCTVFLSWSPFIQGKIIHMFTYHAYLMRGIKLCDLKYRVISKFNVSIGINKKIHTMKLKAIYKWDSTSMSTVTLQ